MRALIIGAGIGGLAAALALRQAGWDVSVFEQAKEQKGIGAGIVLAANAMKALDALGAGEQVRAYGSPVRRADIRDDKGALLVQLPVAHQAVRYGADSYLIHRADLQQALLDAWRPEDVKLDKRFIRYGEESGHVWAEFADGSGAAGDLLIGADGIHSAVRVQLFGEERLRYSGYTAIRGIAHLVDERYPLEAGGGFEAWGKGARFGFSHIGHNRIHWFAAINAPAGERDGPLGRKQETIRRFEDWYGPIQEVIAATPESAILRHDIYDRRPLASWGRGRVLLMGDAAHPMLPNLGQGAGQALEDAIVLGRCMAGDLSVEQARVRYEDIRMKRVHAIVRGSRLMGRMTQLENPVAIGIRNLMLRTIPARVQCRRLDWIAGHEID